MGNKTQVTYEDRVTLDGELQAAIAEILSAETEAKSIIEQAEITVGSIRQDGAALERDMREANAQKIAEVRDETLSAALARAEEDRAERVAAAEREGEKLVASKKELIQKRINELYASLGDK